MGLLAIAWVPIAAPIYWLGYTFGYSNITEIVALALLYLGFLWGLPRWGKHIHRWPQPLKQYGLVKNAATARNLGVALVIGVLGVFALFGIKTLMGWATPSAPSPRIGRFVIEGLIMALAVGFAEETLFRGWVLAELEQSYSATISLVVNALLFASTHFIKPWPEIVRTFPQFLGLVILGMALVWARRSPGRFGTSSSLGYPIGLHAGLIWGYYIVNVGGLSEPTGRAPEWITGIDSNPLAGLLGLILLGIIAAQFAKIAKPKTQIFLDSKA
ncbi:MAG: CAAX amino terminal protease family [Phormidesmis priestleyi Ana]|uniref:CAAX amino terminal protease family n=1 Tax=Phormidesmis priestleyi Ana TaxID=1666911 RepID=A0A0P8DKI7_9CYAN|nr:MAG: CAAX amino terminal protease family [Phormidesmis priestleyi Ana]